MVIIRVDKDPTLGHVVVTLCTIRYDTISGDPAQSALSTHCMCAHLIDGPLTSGKSVNHFS